MRMRALKNNWLRAGITLLFLLGAFFVVKAMNKSKESVPAVKQPAEKTWYYQLNSTNPADIDNPANYALSKPMNAGECGVPLATVICSITDVEGSSGQPAFTHGNVSSNPTSYARTLRLPTTP